MKIDVKQFAGECTCGKTHDILVKDIIVEWDAIKRLPEILAQKPYCDYGKPVLICDENTWKAAGREICEELLHIEYICLNPNNLHADENSVQKVLDNLADDVGILIAAGSGTIHDITRYSAYKRGLPFISVPTAASVDGFVSTIAAMTWHGLKITFFAESPICVVADSHIFSKAPYRLTASGISDLLGKYIAIADWKISSILTGEYICDRVIGYELEALQKVCGCINELHLGNVDACENLMYALLLSGLAMQMVGDSRPASGAEHHISHLIEMEVINSHVDAYHGEKVSCGLMLALEEYHKIEKMLCEKTLCTKPYNGIEKDILHDAFDKKGLFDEIIKENTPDPLENVSFERLLKCSDEIVVVLSSLPQTEAMASLLKSAGCIGQLEQIGLNEELVPKLLELSPYVRGRLTLMRIRKLFER